MPRDLEKQREYCRQWKKRNPERLKSIERKRFLKRHYGLTPEDYNQMLLAQNGCCAICLKHSDDEPKHLAVDHCHETGRIRGLLCNDCNRNLIRNRTLDIMQRAVEYLSNGQMGFAVPQSRPRSSDLVEGPLDEGRVRNRRPRTPKKDGGGV